MESSLIHKSGQLHFASLPVVAHSTLDTLRTLFSILGYLSIYLLQSISPDREFAKAYYAHSQHCNKHSNSNFQCIEKSEASEFTSNTTDSNCTQIQHLTKLYTLVMKPVLLRSETTHTDTKVVSKTKTSIILVLLVLVLRLEELEEVTNQK